MSGRNRTIIFRTLETKVDHEFLIPVCCLCEMQSPPNLLQEATETIAMALQRNCLREDYLLAILRGGPLVLVVVVLVAYINSLIF